MTETRWKLFAWGNPPDVSDVVAEMPERPIYEAFCEEPYHQQWYSVPTTREDLLALSARHPAVLLIAEIAHGNEVICLMNGALLAEVRADPLELERAWLALGFVNVPPGDGIGDG